MTNSMKQTVINALRIRGLNQKYAKEEKVTDNLRAIDYNRYIAVPRSIKRYSEVRKPPSNSTLTPQIYKSSIMDTLTRSKAKQRRSKIDPFSARQTTNPTWWKRRSSLERGLTVVAVCAVLAAIGLAIGLVVIAVNSETCKTAMRAEPLLGNQRDSSKKHVQIVEKPAESNICFTPGCIHTASSILENMDQDVDPCDDFYRFTCGKFLKSTTIPDDKTGVNTFTIIDDKLQKQLRSIIEEPSTPNEARPFKLAKNFYKACMNKTAIENQGLQTVHKILKELGGWPVLMGDEWSDGDFSWKESVYKFYKAGFANDYFIDISVTSDLKNSTKRIIDIDQAVLGLNREYLSKGLDNKIVKAYYQYMVDVAEFLNPNINVNVAKKELMESLQFEMKLANISLPKEQRRNATALYNLMSLSEMTRRFPTVPWKEYFNTLLAPQRIGEDEVVNVNVPDFVSKLEKLLEQTPKRIQANYALWRAAGSSVTYLNDEIRKKQLAYVTVFTGKTEREPRWMECVGAVTKSFSLGVGALYVKRYFNENAKKNAVEMVHNIRLEFKKILSEVEWMDENTRKAALDKAESMSTHIAYPDELLDDKKLDEFYRELEVTSDNYFEAALNISRFGNDYVFGLLRKPVNKSDWVSHGRPAIVNAFYSSTENSIQFPAGILQGAFFSDDRPKYMNYGAIGFVIGHEITHGFDDQGSQFDKDGNLAEWWAKPTKEQYLKRADCVIKQYSNYTSAEAGLNLNGINTQGENIADNGGIKEAYLAYNEYVRQTGAEPRLPGLDFTNQQMFWISAANTWCSVYRPESLKNRITTGQHSPGEFRVIGPLSNREEFAKDFNCPAGSKMNPVHKCSVW
uniref:Neprilysin-2 n=1 Tax=Trichogramma kaykai TaxID=54128 RepID=A0ABD2WDE5_9HYME